MNKKVSALQAAIANTSGKRPAEAKVARPQGEESAASSREGKINISAWLSPAYKSSLRMVQAKTGQKMQELLAEALNELFARHDVPQVRDD